MLRLQSTLGPHDHQADLPALSTGFCLLSQVEAMHSGRWVGGPALIPRRNMESLIMKVVNLVE